MLKLKKDYRTDNLKKYKFIFDGCGNWLYGANHFWFKKMYINEAERVLHIEDWKIKECINTIFDMIKDDVFEKVEDKGE